MQTPRREEQREHTVWRTLHRNEYKRWRDPSYGLLVGCGAEVGYKLLDNLNCVQVTSLEDLVELKKWLIETNGVEHHIKIVAFDTGDELVLLADKKTIAISNKENPQKPCRSIKAAMGGYTARLIFPICSSMVLQRG